MEKIVARERGFTLIELIIVIAIIAIIVAAVFVAMDPVKRLNASRNARRSNDATTFAQALNLAVTDKQVSGTDLAVNTILKANSSVNVANSYGCSGTDGCVGDWFMIAQFSSSPGSASSKVAAAGECASSSMAAAGVTNTNQLANCGGITFVSGCVNVQSDLISGYLPTIPKDPGLPSGVNIPTGYGVKFENGAYWVRACRVESEQAGGAGTVPAAIEVSR